jgi:uncharacterized protein YndB with AHSA1/START domain
MKLHVEASINETPTRVWEILGDFAAWPKWNPTIERVQFSTKKDSKKIIVKPKDQEPFKATLVSYVVEREIVFKRKGFLNSETHSMRIEDSPGSASTMFHYEIEIHGHLSKERQGDEEELQKKMDNMARALRARIYNCVTCF